jgi:hypothetical protein
MPDKKKDDDTKLSETEKTDLIRKLIGNQLSIAHHTEKLVFDIAKIASIIIGVIAFIGIPNMIAFQSDDLLLQVTVQTVAIGGVFYAVVCIIVITYAIYSMGGMNLNVRGSFGVSAWWYSDDELLRIMKINDDNERLKWFQKYRTKFTSNYLNCSKEELYDREELTYFSLLIRTQHQLKIARRMKRLLLFGLVGMLSFMFGVLVSGLSLI